MATLQRALEISVTAHGDTLDKGGFLYVLHPLRLVHNSETEDERIASALHDVCEDVEGWTLDRLREEGFAEHIVQALDNLTRREGETYAEFIERCCTSLLSIRVKLLDIQDNMNITRIMTLEEKDLGRMKRYHRAYLKLKEAEATWNK